MTPRFLLKLRHEKGGHYIYDNAIRIDLDPGLQPAENLRAKFRMELPNILYSGIQTFSAIRRKHVLCSMNA